MKFKAIHILLLVSSFVAAVLSLSVLNGNTMYIQLIHLLQQPASSEGSIAVLAAAAAAQSQPSNNSNMTSSLSTSSSTSSSSLPDVFQKVENSVVQITSTKSNPNEVIILNGVPQTGRRSTALGSGFVYDSQGHIVTNYHVIDGATKADVTFTDGNIYSANVVG
ncbi:MAG: trypsin-like peptidase domain-containing protein, partial [Nitrososphaeraceae archaeon]